MNTPRKLHWIRLATLALTLSMVAMSAPSSADVVGDLTRLVDQVAGEGGGSDPAGHPVESEDLTAPAARIRNAQGRIAVVSEDRPDRVAALAALSARIAQVSDEFNSGDADMAAVLSGIRDAAAEAGGVRGPDQETVDAARGARDDVLAASQRVSGTIVARGRTAGVDAAVVARAQRLYDEGVGALAAGDHVTAAGKFGGAFGEISSNIKFDLPGFDLRLSFAFGSQTTGLQYTIHKDGLFYIARSQGNSRMKQDSPPNGIGMTSTTRQSIASISKMITATTVMKLLQKRGNLDPRTTLVSDWLPPKWSRHPSIADLTFADVLSHRSGLNGYTEVACCQGSTGSWNAAKSYIAAGRVFQPDPNDATKRRHFYQNTGFALLAVTIARLNPETEAILKFVEAYEKHYNVVVLDDATYRGFAGNVYLDTANSEVLSPSGVSGAICKPPAVNPPLYYDFNNPTANGNGGWISGVACAYGGWYLSSEDLAKFMVHLRYDNALLSSDNRKLMKTNFLGWSDSVIYAGYAQGEHGTYYGHGGDIWLPGGVDTCIMSLPEGVDVALLMNSINGNYGTSYQCNTIRQAFDDSWIKI